MARTNGQRISRIPDERVKSNLSEEQNVRLEEEASKLQQKQDLLAQHIERLEKLRTKKEAMCLP